jgi:hypothetical protein
LYPDTGPSILPERGLLMSWLPQDPLLALVFQIGLVVIACSLLMLVAVFVLRIRLLSRLRREREYDAAWQPLLAECVYGVPAVLPRVPRTMRYHFLKLWNHYHESLDGAARANLRALALAMGLDAVARGMLRSRDLRLRLIAVMTLGHLGDHECRDELRALVSDSSPLLSLAAARALLDIDADSTRDWLVKVMAERKDWPLARLAAMLREAGPDIMTAPLIAALQAAENASQTVRLLRLLETAHTKPAGEAAAAIVRASAEPEVVAAGLRLLRDPRDLDLVRSCAVHPEWVVRAGAARVLGNIGQSEDRRLLAGMLGDAHWWVRYRAAKALIALPFTSLDELEKVRLSLDDRYAADMLAQVIAEARAS